MLSCPPLDLTAFREILEAAGARCTPQRWAVYRVLASADHHPTAEQLYQAVKREIPNISLATVYKALEALVACDLATRLPAAAPDGSALYDARSDRHYHLRCLRTGRVEDLSTPYDPDLIAKLDPELSRRLQGQGFRVTGYRLELVGYYEGAEPRPEPEPESGTEPEPQAHGDA